MISSRRILGLAAVLGTGAVGVAAACSPSAKQLPPQEFTLPTYDGSTITLTEDADPGLTRVLVATPSGPEAGVTIVYQDASGAVIDTGVTDSLGRAARALPAGSQVTALLGPATAPSALTWVGVQPGDLLVARDTKAFLGVYEPTSLDSLPGLPPPYDEAGAVAQYVALDGWCALSFAPQLPAAFGVSPVTCANGLGRFPVLVIAQDPNYQDVAYAYRRGNALAADGGTASVSIGGSWSTSFGAWSATAIHATLSANDYLYAYYGEVADGVLTGGTSQWSSGSTDGGSVPFTFQTHPGFPEFVQTEVGVRGSFGLTYTAYAVRSPAPAPDGSVTIDVSQLLPAIDKAASDFTTDPVRPSTTWTYASGTGGAAGTFVEVRWLDDGDAGTTTKEWTFVLPPSTTTVKAPSLPTSATAWAPGSVSGWNTPLVVSVDTTAGFGADDFRHLAGALPLPTLDNFPSGAAIPPLAADGATTRMTMYGGGGG